MVHLDNFGSSHPSPSSPSRSSISLVFHPISAEPNSYVLRFVIKSKEKRQ